MAPRLRDKVFVSARAPAAAARDDERADSSEAEEIEHEVLRAAGRGEAWAWRALVEAHQRRVHAFVWRMLASRARADVVEDVTQEVFLRIHRGLPRFDPSGPARLQTWLLTIATRTAIDELRRPRRPIATLDGLAEGQIESQPHGPGRPTRPDDWTEQRSLARAVQDAVERLSPPIRAVFVLRAYHDLKLTEIAEALEVDLGTVKSRLFRARQTLKAHLEDIDHGP